jgi:hypothetical protein
MQYLILSSLFYPFSVSVALYSLINTNGKVDAFRSLITVVEENPTSIAQIELISSQSVMRDKSESWKNSKNYSTLRITGSINCVFTGIPRLMAGFTLGKSTSLAFKMLSILMVL